jgi:hypothetical protein
LESYKEWKSFDLLEVLSQLCKEHDRTGTFLLFDLYIYCTVSRFLQIEYQVMTALELQNFFQLLVEGIILNIQHKPFYRKLVYTFKREIILEIMIQSRYRRSYRSIGDISPLASLSTDCATLEALSSLSVDST